MVIDIVNYTEQQYASLSTEKLEEIRKAQLKKNALLQKLEEDRRAEKQRLIDRGIYLSTLWEQINERLTANYEAEVETLRDGLLFFLHYTGNGTEKVPAGVPYPVDYSLSEEDRLNGVRSYYMNAYSNGQARFDAFNKDEFARSYLGELYAPLWHHFLDLT